MLAEVLSKTDLTVLPKLTVVLFTVIYGLAIINAFSKKNKQHYINLSHILFEKESRHDQTK